MAKAVSRSLASQVTDDFKIISKMNATITTATKRLHDLKNVAAASCVVHAVMHGNTTPMNDFLKAVGDAERHDAIVKWACELGPFKWDRDVDTKRMSFFLDKDKAKAMREDEKIKELPAKLVANPYWVYVPPKEVPPFNLKAAILTLVKKADKAKADPVQAAKSTFEGYDELKKWAAAMEAVA
mgnify:FL=1